MSASIHMGLQAEQPREGADWNVITTTRKGKISLFPGVTAEEAREIARQQPRYRVSPWPRINKHLARQRLWGDEVERVNSARVRSNSYSLSDNDISDLKIWKTNSSEELEIWPEPEDSNNAIDFLVGVLEREVAEGILILDYSEPGFLWVKKRFGTHRKYKFSGEVPPGEGAPKDVMTMDDLYAAERRRICERSEEYHRNNSSPSFFKKLFG